MTDHMLFPHHKKRIRGSILSPHGRERLALGAIFAAAALAATGLIHGAQLTNLAAAQALRPQASFYDYYAALTGPRN